MGDPRFDVTLLPAAYGDGIWIEYSSGDQTRRIVIDGGPIDAYAAFEASFTRLPDGDKRVELFVVTHVDGDHIESPVRLLAQRRHHWPFLPIDIWFNGYRHLTTANRQLGPRDGDFLSALIHREANVEWNRAFGGDAVVVPDGSPAPRITLEDGMVLTLLSPDHNGLQEMATVWERDVKAFPPGDLDRALAFLAQDRRYRDAVGTLGPGDLSDKLRQQLRGGDRSKANGSSIAFLAEFQGKSCLLLADAHMPTVCRSIRTLLPDGQNRLTVDAVKLSHHGSKHNLTPEFLELVDAEHFLVSTNGDRHQHPHAAAMDAVIAGASRKPTLWFNYRSTQSAPWEAASLRPGATYATRYPADTSGGITLPLLA